MLRLCAGISIATPKTRGPCNGMPCRPKCPLQNPTNASTLLADMPDERAGRRRTQPKIPMQIRRNRRHFCWPIASRQAFLAPNMARVYCANCPGLNQFDDAAIILAGMYLRAHLCRLPFVFLSQLCDCARLKNRVRERLFAIDVLAQTQRPGGRGCVGGVR